MRRSREASERERERTGMGTGKVRVSEPDGRESRVRGTTIWSSESRVYGGCLGVYWRRRPRQAAKSGGEEHTSRDPPIAEWGNPPGAIPVSAFEYIGCGSRTGGTEPSQYPGKRNQKHRKMHEIPEVAASETGGA
jgi:hypothetical protein